MWLVRLCHENCIKENRGFVECQLCAVKMVGERVEVGVGSVSLGRRSENETPGHST